nr:ROK family protein [Parachlamydiaceae bacterium]
NMRIGVVDDTGNVIEKVIIPTRVELGANAIITNLTTEISSLKLRFEDVNTPLSAIGIAAAGQVDANTGNIKFGPNLNWNDVPIAYVLQKNLNMPVFVANDVRAATFGEWRFGSAKGMQDYICLFIGTGIGGGIVSDGVLMTGCNNSAGEIGHMVISGQGELCTCGNLGCWETQAAGWGIAKLTQEAIRKDPKKGSKILARAHDKLDQVNAKHLFQALIDHDPLAEFLMRGIEKALIDGSTSLVNIFNPECLVFGGGIIDGAPWLIDVIDKGVRRQALKSATEKLKILPAQNFKDAPIIGIATMAMEKIQSHKTL